MLSVVIPLFNEQDSLPELFSRLKKVLHDLKEQHEILFIDDGSTDSSLQVLKKLQQEDKTVRIFSFRTNQGKAEALTFGFQKAKGDYIITLDADLQDRPEEIGKLLEKVKEGYELVCGWRRDRKDASKMVLASKLFNSIAKSIWKLDLHDYNCGFKVYTKDAAKSLFLYGGMHRFIPLLLYQQGFKVSEVGVIHDSRRFGKSKFGFSKTWKDLPDIFTILFLVKYSNRPLHFFGFIGSFLFVVGLVFLGYLTYLHYFLHETVGTRPLWSVGILFTLVGLQIVVTGFLADLMIHLTQKGQKNFSYNDSMLKYNR